MRKLVRDLAIVGGVSSLGAPAAFLLYTPVRAYFEIVVPAGAMTGVLVALIYARAVGEVQGRPWTMLAGVGALLGLLWGGAVGLAGAQAEPRHAGWSILLASLSGAFQLGLFGPLLIRRAASGVRTWPVLIGATAFAPLLGNLAYFMVGVTESWLRLLA